ncbi:VanZ family protein [Candidatus Berkiella aquae]|uniref:VanZ family protein n=2 Tax=Candidatus Berkiella aquae TaxID=295108 RepID=A0AAE3HUF9_9GAMM|nr:VanZ family protein [Candidatus Berkiella aquae]MCS5710887.1 VanZ family protein [Candidatus Berkiella aquae]
MKPSVMNKAEMGKHSFTDSAKDTQLKASVAVLLCLFTAFIFYGALYPFHDWRIPARPTLTILFFDWLEHIFLFDIVQNLLLFLPFGLFFACHLLLKQTSSRTALWLPTIASFCISLSVELLQTFNPVRIPSLLDLALNVISGFLGASMAHWFLRFYPFLLRQITNSIEHFGSKQNIWPFIGMLTWLGFAFYQIYPCIPTLHPHQLWEGVSPVFQFFKGDVPFFIDRFFLYALQGTMLFFSAKLFLKPTHSFPAMLGFITLMFLAKIAIIGRYLTIEMLVGCYGSICLLWAAQKVMEFIPLADKEEIEV